MAMNDGALPVRITCGVGGGGGEGGGEGGGGEGCGGGEGWAAKEALLLARAAVERVAGATLSSRWSRLSWSSLDRCSAMRWRVPQVVGALIGWSAGLGRRSGGGGVACCGPGAANPLRCFI